MNRMIPIDDSELVALVYDPGTIRRSWANEATCLTLDHELFFPDEGEIPPPLALICCAACPVALHCLATALFHEIEDGDRYGWWGGMGPEERQALWGQLGEPPDPEQTPEQENPIGRVLRLRAQRHTIPTIAAELGCSERTVYRILAAHAA